VSVEDSTSGRVFSFRSDCTACLTLYSLRLCVAVLNCTNQPSGCEGSDGVSYLSLGLLDSTADLPRMPAALEAGVGFIHDAIEAGGRVLVHCHRGISRSCTLTIAYIMWAQRCTAEAAFVQVRRARRIADPNLGYWVTLKEWERHVLGTTERDASAFATVSSPS